MRPIVLSFAEPRGGVVQEQHANWDALISRIEAISKVNQEILGIPYSVDLLEDNGYLDVDPSTARRLSIGVGNGQWILCYFAGDTGGPDMYSLGDPTGEGSVAFYFGDWTPMSRKYLVPRDKAIEAIRTWFEKRVLGDTINWTSRIYSA